MRRMTIVDVGVPAVSGIGKHPGRRIGGSDIAKLLGVSKYGNAADVFERVVNGTEEEWNPRMERGAEVEPLLRAFSQTVLGLEIEDRESDYHAHPNNEFAGAQVDDLAKLKGLPVVNEYKSVNRWVKGWGPDGSDIIPEHIRPQVAWQLACTGRDLAIVIAGFGEDSPNGFIMSNVCSYRVERDLSFEGYLMAVAEEFWSDHVMRRVPPSMKPLGKKATP